MELELGFKISKTLDEYSSADLRISKDQAGPVFVSRETETMFVLNAHLKGYKKERIQIEVNEEGTRIAISGERPVQEMVMVKWQMHKKEPEIRGFNKAFNIPEGVKLDKIKARFNEDESVLTIFMPKLEKGLQGLKIREITEEIMQKENDNLRKENDNLAKENDEKIVTEISPSKEIENKEQAVEEANNIVCEEIPPKESEIQGLESENLKKKSVVHQEQGQDEGEDVEREKGKNVVGQEENENGEQVVEEANNAVREKIHSKENEIQGVESDNSNEKSVVHQEQKEQNEGEEGERENGKNVVEQQENEERQNNGNVPKLCVPIIAGTAFIVSLIVFVMHMIRAKNAPNSSKKN